MVFRIVFRIRMIKRMILLLKKSLKMKLRYIITDSGFLE